MTNGKPKAPSEQNPGTSAKTSGEAGSPRKYPEGGPNRRLQYVLAIVAVVATAAAIATQPGNDGGQDTGAAAGRLLRTEAPWPPQTTGLQSRVQAAGFPPVGDESFHVHALLSVYIDGRKLVVPADIGIDRRGGYHSPLHTHAPDGVIHFEADDPSPFTVQQVFAIWGVDFTAGSSARTHAVVTSAFTYMSTVNPWTIQPTTKSRMAITWWSHTAHPAPSPPSRPTMSSETSDAS